MLPAWGEESDTVESQLSKRYLLKLLIYHFKMNDTMSTSPVSMLAAGPSGNMKGRLR